MLVAPPQLIKIRECKTRQKAIMTGLLNGYEKTTQSGDNVTIDDCVQAPAELKIKGKEIKQEVRQGYNLANIDDFSVNAGNGIIGTGKKVYDLKPNTTYTLFFSKTRISGIDITNSSIYPYSGVKFYKDDTLLSSIATSNSYVVNNFSIGTKEFIYQITTPAECNRIEIFFNNNNGDTNANTLVSKVMLLEGSYTAETIPPYETYGPSPSVEFESPLGYVEGNQEVEHVNKNLFDKNAPNIVKGYRLIDDGTLFSQEGYFTSDYILVKPNTEYFTNYKISIMSRICEYDKNKKNIKVNKDNSKTFTTSAEAKYIRLCGSIDGDDITNIQEMLLQTESSDLSYIEGKKQVYQLTNLPPMPSGNDYIYEENGKYFVHNEWGKHNITNDDTVYESITYTSNKSRFSINNLNVFKSVNSQTIEEIYCNITSASSPDLTYMCHEGVCYGTQDNLIIYLDETKNMNSAQFKTYCMEHNVYLIYKLETPVDTEITDPVLINQLNELRKIITYEGTNNFIVTSENGQSMDLEVTAYKNSMKIMQKQNENMQKEIDRLEELVMNNIVAS